MNKYRFTYTDEVYAENEEEAKAILIELYAKQGLLELLDMIFDKPYKKNTLDTGGIFKRIKK